MPTTGADAAPRTIEVVAGVIFDASRERVLLSLRKPDQHQGGLWEFPGGKLEAGEGVVPALARELDEELGIAVLETAERCSLEHAYPDKIVRLRVLDVLAFSGEPRGREGQELRWVAVQELAEVAFPAANAPIVESLLAARS